MQKRRVTLKHKELRDNIAEMLQEVKNDIRRTEPILQPLTGEEQSIGGNVSVEAQVDISARFSCCEQRAFFDVRIFDPNAQRLENKTLT